MYTKRAIVWFRQDLRLHDNEALTDALKSADEIIPVYVFDERVFGGLTRFGFPKTGKYRAQFIIEAVADLRQSLRALKSDLIIRVGKPEEILYEMARTAKTSWIFCNRERTQEEVAVQDALEKNLWSIGQEMRYSRGKMLYYTADLPFPVTHTPDTFSQFRKEVERPVPIRQPLPPPSEPFEPLSVRIEPGDIPTLSELGLEEFEPDPRTVIHFQGGETAGLARLRYYLWESGSAQTYKDTRNGLLYGDDASRFSAWLAQGCLSPKTIYHAVRDYELVHGANDSTYWLTYELLWRDFFRFMAKKHGNKIFQAGGIKGEVNADWRDDRELFQRWINGTTGVPFIDANMRELSHTGYMSNRGRQNVASFLVHDLQLNWLLGADYFESMLIDYDPASNYGNWMYIAGVGNDTRDTRYFNILSQAKRYDPDGSYIRKWLPELAQLPEDAVYRPECLSPSEQDTFHLKIGTDYPQALIDTNKWN